MKIRPLRVSLLSLILALILSGCLRIGSSPVVNLSRLTPQPESSPFSVSPDDKNPLPTPTLHPANQRFLRAYPLWVGSSWIYAQVAYDAEQEVTYQVVITVVDTWLLDGAFVAEMEEKVTLIEGNPSADFSEAPTNDHYWYLLVEDHLFRYASPPDGDMTSAWLEMIFPFPDPDEGWYPAPDLRIQQYPDREGWRTVSEPYQKRLATGGIYTCYNMATSLARNVMESTFCEQIGFVYEEWLHFDTTSGYRRELTGFSVQ